MELNSIVIVSLIEPREKIWGQLVSLVPAGITVRGLDLNSFDDFLGRLRHGPDAAAALSTVFYPLHRVERIALDEPCASIPSHSDRFREVAGITIQEFLGIQPRSA